MPCLYTPGHTTTPTTHPRVLQVLQGARVLSVNRGSEMEVTSSVWIEYGETCVYMRFHDGVITSFAFGTFVSFASSRYLSVVIFIRTSCRSGTRAGTRRRRISNRAKWTDCPQIYGSQGWLEECWVYLGGIRGCEIEDPC